MSRTEYICAGMTIYRVTGDEYEAWAYPTARITKDLVLGGSGVYLDIGANEYPPLSFRASCQSQTDRTTLVAAQGTEVTIANSKGHSNAAVLVKAMPINGNPQNLWLVDLVLEIVP